MNLLTYVIIAVVLFFVIKNLMPLYYKNKSRNEFKNGSYSDAKKHYEKAMSLEKQNFNSKIEYTYMLLRMGLFEDALHVTETTLAYKLEPQNRSKAILQRCMCYYKTGNFDEAYNDICQLYDDGYRSMAMYGLMGLFKILKDPNSEDTYNFCLEAYDYADDDRDICDNMTICYYNRAEYEKAKKISDTVIEKNPSFIEGWYHGAQIDYAMGNYKSAKNKLDKISDCTRSPMTTISESDVNSFMEKVSLKLKENN